MAARLDGSSQDRRVRVQGRPVDSYPQFGPEVERGAVHRITVVGDDVLRRRCQEVTAFGTTELSRLIDDMFATNRVARGAGLAANQIGVDLRVFMWDITDDWGVRHVGHIVNPVLDEIPSEDRRLVDESEGCLSVPGPYRVVPRPDRAVVRGRDKDGAPLVIEGRGYFARCLQHETDHLHGRLYLDRLARRERATALREMAEAKDGVLARRAELAAKLGK
ncbi:MULTISPECIES: peptide deformylase [Streptomyces]|uniref:peptide deformylase n=1 Tax=Streptomyces TaxID=1883 RepID=UPI000241B320|nr:MULTISPECIES: peptide deformylase [Streptomyces]EHM25581.1 peptide deformylase [Streptomyces sp. W007]MCX4487647.1 peptide deformylase [Streptomyces anulatus]MCX4522235.1 peptide deformylase [Streptomyces anulatus]MCX4605112.1 peptide deformylase [Streptomyces anulatus]OKI53888.1 peptide deformylase [Streptomyces sp. CB00072]